jgi:hypothetical protein
LWTFLVVKVGNIWAISALGSQPLCASANVAILSLSCSMPENMLAADKPVRAFHNQTRKEFA